MVSLQRRGVVDCLHDHGLQVGVHRSLVHFHQFSVEHVLPVTEHLLSLPLTRFLGLSLATLVLGDLDHQVDASLLLQAHEFLRQVVHRLRNHGSLHCLSDSVHDSLLVVVNKKVFFLSLGVAFPLFSGAKLSDQVKSLFFTLEHHVLLSTTTEESLEKDDGSASLVTVLHLGLVFVKLAFSLGDQVFSLGRVSSEIDLLLLIAIVSSLLGALLLRSILDVLLSLAEGTLVVTILPREHLPELEPHLVNADLGVEHRRFVLSKNLVKLVETLVGGEGLWLHFVLVGFLVERETVTRDWGVHGRAEVGVLFDDVAALGIYLDTLASFVHLSKHLNTFALNFGQGSLLVLSFLEADLFGALGMLLFQIALTFDKG